VPNFSEAVHILFRLLRASPHVSQHSSLYATNIRQVVKHQPQERASFRMSPKPYQAFDQSALQGPTDSNRRAATLPVAWAPHWL